MRTLAVVVLIFGLSLAPSARANADAGSDLETVMKSIKAKYSEVAKQVSDATRNEASATLSLDLSMLILQAAALMPTKLSKLPGADRELPFIEYRRQIAQLYVASLDLEKAFREDRNADAKTILGTMDALKKQGHSQFESHVDHPRNPSQP